MEHKISACYPGKNWKFIQFICSHVDKNTQVDLFSSRKQIMKGRRDYVMLQMGFEILYGSGRFSALLDVFYSMQYQWHPQRILNNML